MEGSHTNAFRHGLWQSTITNKFGESVAKQVGNAHEDNPFTDISQRGFESLSEVDQTIDLLNNQIGRAIGKANPKASMQELALKTLDYFKENGLYTATKGEDGKYSISLTKLTDEQYEKAKGLLNSTNNNGFTPKQQQKRDDEAKEEIQQLDNAEKFGPKN